MENPLIVMCAITGKPKDKQIFEYMNSLKENGINQAMLYPRAGCELEYLSDEWFETIGYFITNAKKLDMNIWLYDEFNFPSGNANGLVTAIDEFRLKYIYTSGENTGKIISAQSDSNHTFGVQYFPNLILDEAVDLFIKATHEKYYEKFGKYFGNVIKGMFTDEPALSYWKPENSVVYSKEMEKDYTEYTGRNFMEDVYSGYKDIYKITTKIVGDRFNKCYISKIKNWCKNHNIIMTGHLMDDHEPFWAIRRNGNLLKNLSSFGMPGIDEIRTNFEAETIFNLFGTAEYASGENGAMAELFAVGPCDMSFAKKKCMLYFAACHKINNYFLAISHFDMRGNFKIKSYFNTFTDDQPDFCGMKLLAKEAEICSEYAKKDYKPDVYVRYPTKICTEKTHEKINIQPFYYIINTLTKNQVQWKFLDTDEPGEDISVIEFANDFEYIYKGITYKKADDICKLIDNEKIITDINGNIPEGFFVRKFNDDSFLILNLYAKADFYNILGKKMWIDKYQIITNEYYKNYSLDVKKEAIDAEFEVNYLNNNMVRLMYLNDQKEAKLCCMEDTKVFFAIRNGVKAYIDNSKIVCTNINNNLLSRGIKNLYGTSDEILLKKGTYTIKSDDDYKYMPSVFVSGDFSHKFNPTDVCEVILNQRKKKAIAKDVVSDFGKVEFCADIKIPKGVKKLELKTADLYTSLYINNNLVDEKICHPFIFDIDSALWNKTVNIKIVQYSSIAPIFGDLKYYDKVSINNAGLKATPPDSEVKFGFESISFVL
ncbi:MAG: hypothetical protein E7404_00700 [Ruminococcaceae bacterium]|nr:hypothetical protein [Oscillospiraceae bacterium]